MECWRLTPITPNQWTEWTENLKTPDNNTKLANIDGPAASRHLWWHQVLDGLEALNQGKWGRAQYQEDSSQCWFRIKEFQHHPSSKTNMKLNWLLKNHNAIIWGTEKVWNPNDWFGDNQTARQLARQGIRRKGLCFEIKFIKSHFLYFSPKYLHNPMINFVLKGTIASVWLWDSSGKIQ